ncbi:hypothetical protein [Haloarcula onubensis]|uniref:Uncharacterized protein n=1 Tax=Haloarcula onubensis TaxID=2950539 RepID=A0ABU2FPL0_9EURY|nr:hypothetical protein [Halomicroarcula sp. S3CR25-11]MDS0282691.1 hypothetical protein [Halomicroarcula sp. S3CR25-11]
MPSQLTVKTVEQRGDHYDVSFRDADEFDGLETPDWATDLAESKVSGSEVRMGRDGTDDWFIQSVRVPADHVDSEGDASRKALEVATVISEHELYDSQ